MSGVVRSRTMTVVAVLIFAANMPAQADVTAVQGSAFGYRSSISLFGGPAETRGPAPTVTLPTGGSGTPVTATQSSASATHGPAIIFTSGPLTVTTQGETGQGETVTTSTDIDDINTSGQEVFTADNAASTCGASESGTAGSTTITNGTLRTSEGNPDVEGDETVVNIPSNPAPNTTYEGQFESAGDSFRYVFNEQVVNADGSITVNAAHQIFLGPTAVGDLIIGQAVCGVTAIPDTTPPRVKRTEPVAGAPDVWPKANIKAKFSEPMKGSSVNGTTFMLFKKGSTTQVVASVRYDAATRKAILDPTDPLRRGITYKAVVTTFARDKAGNRLDQKPNVTGRQKKVWFFTVRS